MVKITVEITDEQKEFLKLIQHEDATTNQSTAIQWCIDNCMKIEERYKIDACYIAHNNLISVEQIENRINIEYDRYKDSSYTNWIKLVAVKLFDAIVNQNT